VLLLGPVPTPAVGFLTRSMRADVGVMISASHNPYEDNGIKLFGPDGFKLSDAVEEQIEALVASRQDIRLAASKMIGRAKRLDDADGRYIEAVKASVRRRLDLTGLKIVIDCANGAAYKVAPTVLWELGAEVIPLAVSPDGFNINDKCGSTHPGTLQESVMMHGADIGIALDGDADRVILVSERRTGDRRRPAHGDDRQPLGQGRPAGRRRRRRHRDVQSRPRALSRRTQASPGARRGRRPLRARVHAGRRLQSRRRAIRPYHHDRPRHDR
jgi:phosphomannomutase